MAKKFIPRKREVEEPYKINEKIRAAEVRLVGDNVEQSVFSLAAAKAMAKEQSLDLVEIVPNATPPVCRIVDYSKFKYEIKKKQKELKAKQQKTVIKEIRFGPQTDEHDFNFKAKHAQNFLKEGAKVKAYVHFVGRQIVFKSQGYELLEKFIGLLDDVGKPEAPPKLEGKRLTVILTPKK